MSSPNQFQQTTSTNWFQRLGGSFKGILMGIVLFFLAFPLLFWGEFRAVAQYKSLEAGQAAVVETPLDAIDADLEGQLVHVTGKLAVDGSVTDPDFPLTVQAVSLKREVEMYQWEEHSSQQSRKKLGGGEETVTTYRYEKTWSQRVIPSGNFQQQQSQEGVSYTNPSAMPFESTETIVEQARLGAHVLSQDMLGGIGSVQQVPLTEELLTAVRATTGRPVSIEGKSLYFGDDPAQPAIGDMQVRFTMAVPANVSVVARQSGDGFTRYQSKKVKKGVLMVRNGSLSADDLFESAKTQNKILTWALRVGGFMMMFGGLVMILSPLSVLGDVVPLIGTIIGAGASIVAFLVSAILSLLVIAIAWIAARPLVGIVLLLAVGGLLFGLHKLRKNAQAKVAPANAT